MTPWREKCEASSRDEATSGREWEGVGVGVVGWPQLPPSCVDRLDLLAVDTPLAPSDTQLRGPEFPGFLYPWGKFITLEYNYTGRFEYKNSGRV